MMMLNQVKKEKTNEELEPNIGGHDRPFRKINSNDKRSRNKHKHK
jgi:hypothetical protein